MSKCAPTGEVYYDPYDPTIDDDPYPVWKRMRDEAPLYRNEEHDFYALSRWDDVEAALIDWETYQSGKGTIFEIITADELDEHLSSARWTLIAPRMERTR